MKNLKQAPVKKISVSFLFLVVFFNQSLYSQQSYFIEGIVYNVETKEPVVNANIVVMENNTGTSTNSEGSFNLKLTEGVYRVRISSVGFSDKRLTLMVPSETSEVIRIALQPGKFEIEDVDVYGDFYLADNDSSIEKVPVSLLPAVTRISSIEIEKQGAVTLTDALKYVPGGWTESRGRKTKQFFSVRGQKYPYPDYSINGIWQKEFEETVYFFSALDIESIEIIRSSSALVKGLSGLTGVVDVKTKMPDREMGSITAKYGELNNYVTNVQYGNKMNDFSFNSSIAFFGTDGPPERKGKERISSFYGNFDWKINTKFQLFAGANYINGLREFVKIVEPGSPKFLNWDEKYDPVRSLLTYAKLSYQGEDGSVTELQVNWTWRNSEYIRFAIDEKATSSHGGKDWEYGLNMLHSRSFFQGNTLRLGVLYNHWEAPDGKRYYAGRSCDVHTWSGVAASEQKAGRFLFDAGFRIIGGHIVEWGGFGIEGSGAGFQEVDPIKDQASPLQWQSALGASYRLSGPFSLHYNFSGGTIAPRNGSLDNQGERPENEARFQHDLGFRYKSPRGNELSVSAFYVQRKNAIELNGQTITTGNDYMIELYENLDKRNYGLELSTKLFIPGFHSYVFANGTFMKGENEMDRSMVPDDKLPSMILNTGIQFEYSGFDGNIFAGYTGPYSNNRFVSKSWISENGDFPLGDFVTVDLTAGYSFSGKFPTRIFVEMKNLLDKEYFTVAGYPDPGRLLYSGIKIDF